MLISKLFMKVELKPTDYKVFHFSKKMYLYYKFISILHK